MDHGEGGADGTEGPNGSLALFKGRDSDSWLKGMGWSRGTGQIRYIPIPLGNEEKDGWKIFMDVAAAVDPRASEGFERSAPSEIVVDITHGYRAHGFLGAGAVAFSLAEAARRRADDRLSDPRGRVLDWGPRLRVLYGAFDTRAFDSGTKKFPIWDLTTFITASEWTRALEGVRYGRADDARDLALKQDRGRRSHVARFGAALASYANDLSLVRLRDLFTGRGTDPKSRRGSAARLVDTIDASAMSKVLEELPFLRGVVAELRADAAPLASRSVLKADGVRAAAHLARLCLRLERFSEAAVIIRETVVSAFALRRAGTIRVVDPEETLGDLTCRDTRCEAESALRVELQDVGAVSYTQGMPPDLALWESFVMARNDIEHGGLNRRPEKARVLRRQLREASDALRIVVDSLPDLE